MVKQKKSRKIKKASQQEQKRQQNIIEKNLSVINKYNIVDQLKARVLQSHTPDFIYLKKQRTHHPVFVYGTLKKGGRLHKVLEGCDYLGTAYTMIARWDLRNAPGNHFPVLLDVGTTADFTAKIQGEVYAVDPKTLLELDDIEANGTMYNRQEIWVSLRDQIYKTTSGDRHPNLKCFGYVGAPDYWKSQMERMFRCPYTLGPDDKRIFLQWSQGATSQSYTEYLQEQFRKDLDDAIPFERRVG